MREIDKRHQCNYHYEGQQYY